MTAVPAHRLAGREITPQELRSPRFPTLKEEFKPSYAWSAGVALGRFLRELRRGRLIGRRCTHCRRVLVPPRLFCEQCYRVTDAWVYVKDQGTVNTYSVSYVGADASPLREPQIVAVIELDGASPGMGILHLLGHTRAELVQIGMRVRAVWKRAADRQGAITDIRFFEPWEEAR